MRFERLIREAVINAWLLKLSRPAQVVFPAVITGVFLWRVAEVSLQSTHGANSPVQLEKSPQVDGPPTGSIVWRKLDIWILPSCTCLFLLYALDTSNIGNARLAGLQTSLAMSDHQYSLALTVTMVPYLFAAFPASLLLKRIGPNVMLPTMAILWGVASGAQGFVHNYAGLLLCRFFLGLVEGGIVPGIVLYLSLFYPRNKLQLRMAIFFASASLTGAFSGLLAAAIDQMNGIAGRPGWAWIFIMESTISIVFGIISFFLLPRSPETARFLTEQERIYVISTLKDAGSASEDDAEDSIISWNEVVRAAQSPHVWFLTINGFLGGTIIFAIAFFEPTIVASLGYEGNQAQLMSVPPYAVTTVLALVSAFVSDRYQRRGYSAILFSSLQVIGFTMFYWYVGIIAYLSLLDEPLFDFTITACTSSYVRYASLVVFVTGAFGASPALMTWQANNSAPHARRATALAINFIASEMGGILATWMLGPLSPGPNYTAAMITFIAMSVGMVVLCIVNLLYLWRENRLKAEKRQRMTKDDEPGGLGDRSAWFIYSL
ncbi:major facilitator superfamily domain-containing protein [Chiua virens]|nr:major facilitator superfamily domain-containing protein [Chiua virens]